MAKDVTLSFAGELTELKSALRKAADDQTLSMAVLGGVTGNLFAVVAGMAVVVKKTVETGVEWAAGATEASATQAKLAAVVEATGGAAGITAAELADTALAMRRLTGIDDDLVKSAQTVLATFKEVRGDEFDRTTMAAADLATVLGGDIQGAAMQLGKALNDPVKGMTTLAKSGVGFTAEQAKMIEAMQRAGDIAGAQGVILAEVEEQVGGAAAAAADAAGPWAEFAFVAGDVTDALGGGLLAALEPLLPLLESGAELTGEFARSFEDELPAIKSIAVDVVEYVAASTAAVGALAAVAWNRLPEVFAYAVDSAALEAIGFANDVTFFFTDTAPTLLTWFADNWQEIFTDIYNYVGTVLGNMFENIITFFEGVWDYIAGNETTFEFRGLTDGFAATLTAMPEIAGRELSDAELALMARTDAAAASLAADFNQKFAGNLDALGFNRIDDDRDRAAVASAAVGADTKTTTVRGAAKETTADEFKASIEGLASLFTRIQTAAATPQTRKLQAMERQAAGMEQQAAAWKANTEAVAKINAEAHKRQLRLVG